MRSVVARSLVAVTIAGCAGLEPPLDTAEAPSELVAAAPELADEAVAPGDVVALSPEDLVRVGLEKHERGEYALAAEDFLAATATFPASRALAARSIMEEGRLADAYAQAVEAVRATPDHPLTQFVLGLVAQRDGRSDEALEAYRRVLELDPGNAGAHNNIGGIYYHREDFRRARYETEDALAFSTDDQGRSIAEANLAELDALEGKLELAEERLDRALAYAPEAAHAYFSLAALYDVTGREDAARTMAEQGVSLDPLGTTRRAISFVWPELELHQDALLAEARGDRAKAAELWSRLAAIESDRALEWEPLAGRAAAHLARLADPVAVATAPRVELRPVVRDDVEPVREVEVSVFRAGTFVGTERMPVTQLGDAGVRCDRCGGCIRYVE